MRELTKSEIETVSGGATVIPFTNLIIPGPNWPGGAAGAWAAIPVAYGTGRSIGNAINDGVNSNFSMSTGEALYRTLNS